MILCCFEGVLGMALSEEVALFVLLAFFAFDVVDMDGCGPI